MWDRFRHVWLPRACRRSRVNPVLALAATVVAAPWFAWDDAPLLALFADNSGVRGAAIAGAVGLLVTARVFFRARPEKRSPKEPPRGNMAGA